MDENFQLTETISSNIIPFPRTGLQLQEETTSAPRKAKFEGPLSASLWAKANKVPSKYPDTFDYGIYDRIYERFGKNQPRGGVTFKSGIKLANYHSSCAQCHYSFEIDTYGRGCVHNCTYCYAKEQLSQYGYWNNPQPFPIDIAEVRKLFATVFESNRFSKWRPILERKVPLRIGSMSDSFMWLDKRYRVTHELLKILKHYRYPYVVFTRSDLAANDEYMEALDPALGSIQYSISGIDENLTRIIEPGAPSVAKRLAALKKLREAGFWTTVRLNPLFPTYPDGYFTDQRSIGARFGSGPVPSLRFFDIDKAGEFIDALAEAKVPSLLAGFVRLKPIGINAIAKATGVNFRSFFRPEVMAANDDKHYSDSEIAYYYKVLQSLSVRKGVRFSTCYIGNGQKDYVQYQSLWSNPSDCCDARGNVPEIRESAQSIPWSERIKHAPTKEAALLNAEKLGISDEMPRPGLTTSLAASTPQVVGYEA